MRTMLHLAALPVLLAASPTLAGEPASDTQRMAEASQAFLSTLRPEQRTLAVREMGDEAARTAWSYLPESMARREGIALSQLDDAQRNAAHTMLGAALSSQGYGKLVQIMRLEGVLRVAEGEALKNATIASEERARREAFLRGRDPTKYWLAMFGEPGRDNWGWTFSGHHFAVNLTVVGGRAAFTPMFVGANPQAIRTGEYAGARVLQHAIDKAFALMASLDDGQRQTAVVAAQVPETLIADKGRKGDAAAFEGIRADQLGAAQRAMLMRLIGEFVGDVSDETAAAQRRAIERDRSDSLHLAWWGPTGDPAQRFMYRVHGPSILIELIREKAADGSPANHIHAIVRDPRNDYGEGWLGQHYREHHPSP